MAATAATARTRAGAGASKPAAAPASPADLHRRTSIRAVAQLRWIPHRMLFVTALAGFLAWAFGWIAQTMSGPLARITVAVGIAGLFLVVAYLVWRAIRRSATGRLWRRRYWLAATVATTWVAAIGVMGFSWPLVASAVAAELVLAARWWQVHRPGLPSPIPEPVLPVVQPADYDPYPQMWASNIACSGGALPGSRLTEHVVTERGHSYLLQLKLGTGGLSQAMSRLELIASGLRLSPDALVLDTATRQARNESTADGDFDEESEPIKDISQLRLQIVMKSPIRKTVPFSGPSYTYDPATFRGVVDLGPYADGDGLAPFVLYTEDSMWGGTFLGTTGSGKSAALTSLVTSIRGGGHTVIFYVDPQNGASSPALAKHTTWPVLDRDLFEDFTAAVERIMDFRSTENTVHEWTGFTPSPQRPGILIVIDECHVFFGHPSKDFASRWSQIARQGRKVGISILAASQHSGLDVFGNNDALRSSLNGGNVIGMRTMSNVAQHLLPAEFPDLNELPTLPGYAYIKPYGEGRLAPFRFYFLPSATKAPDTYNDARALLENPEPELDEIAQLAAGAAFASRGDPATDNQAAGQARLDALRRGELSFGASARPRTAELRNPPPVVFPAPQLTVIDGEVTSAASDEKTEQADEDVEVPRRPGKRAVNIPASFSDERRAAVVAVLAALDDGLFLLRDILASVGKPRATVQRELTWLKDEGHVVNPNRGEWRYVDEPADDSATAS